MKKKFADDLFPDYKIVNLFVEAFNDEEVRLKPEANKIFFKENGKKQSLTSLLSDAITNYTLLTSGLDRLQTVYEGIKKDSTFYSAYNEQYKIAKECRTKCLTYINFAKSNDLIVETDRLLPKLAKLKQENEQLKEKNARLQKLNSELAKRLNQLFPDKGKREIGDLNSLDS